MPKNKKLVLFDIDGTLIRHFGPQVTIGGGWKRFIYALQKVFNINVHIDPAYNYHGLVDRQILFDLVKSYGITKNEFDNKFPDIKAAIVYHAQTREKKQIYEPIPEALQLLTLLHKKPNDYYLGILTGNVERMAYWKLTHVGIDPTWFTLFITSDEFDDRISLAKSVFEKHKKTYGLDIHAHDIYVLGDAVGDIRCAYAIGAKSIIATTGRHDKAELEKENPTLLVNSLMDPLVLTLLEL